MGRYPDFGMACVTFIRHAAKGPVENKTEGEHGPSDVGFFRDSHSTI